jgi:serine/threonine protein kinase
MAGAPLIDLSRYVFEALRKDEEYILYRAQSEDVAFQVLVLSPAVQRPTPESLKRLEHEYSLREALDPRWAARPIATARRRARTVLVLEDPGGAPLDQLLGHPLDVAFSLRLAIGLSTAIGQLHQRGLIHKDIKPPNVLVNSVTGQGWLRGFGIASRLLATRTPPEQREKAIFGIVNQLNRGAALITSRDEREQLAELNLIAGKRAKASTAYTSAPGPGRSGLRRHGF